MSLFAWAPVAVWFAAVFTRLTDLEFRATSEARVDPEAHLTFSLGVLVTDEKTPVVKSVDFTEDELLKWAKKSFKDNALALDAGTIAMLYAQTPEAIPAYLEAYREETYLLRRRRDQDEAPDALDEPRFALCATLRPFSAEELTTLLAAAREVVAQGDLGRLQRLAGAFYGARQGARAGRLHYAYQKERTGSDGWLRRVERHLAPIAGGSKAPLVDVQVSPGRGPGRWAFGLEPKQEAVDDLGAVQFSPLWDLVELAKLMT